MQFLNQRETARSAPANFLAVKDLPVAKVVVRLVAFGGGPCADQHIGQGQQFWTGWSEVGNTPSVNAWRQKWIEFLEFGSVRLGTVRGLGLRETEAGRDPARDENWGDWSRASRDLLLSNQRESRLGTNLRRAQGANARVGIAPNSAGRELSIFWWREYARTRQLCQSGSHLGEAEGPGLTRSSLCFRYFSCAMNRLRKWS